ncbi:MAG: Cys-tRNA(Pro) deacylase [Erysipelotrichaceae bacterium]
MKNIKTNVMRILDKAKIDYKAYNYDTSDEQIDGISVAQKLGQNPKQVFKTIITQGHSKNFYVFVIAVDAELNLKLCASSVNEKSIELIPLNKLTQITGYIRGGCSPIGLKKSFPCVVDESALGFPTIIFSAGKKGFQVDMNPKDLEKIIDVQFNKISMK